ncbi:MAG: hypothetical protein IIB00_10960 [candidate division Zixibacteria bacterium]|nr:hypothetical protein [candidate division Zixibacteria bacterium]
MSTDSPASRTFLEIAVIVSVFVSALSCGKPTAVNIEERRSVSKEETTAPVEIIEKLDFDPLGNELDRIVVPEAFAKDTSSKEEGLGIIGPAPPPDFGLAVDTSGEAYDVYQAQLFNSTIYSESFLERRIAEEIFDEPVFLDYEAPYFKVRLGEFRKKREAENYLRQIVKRSGYNDAWVLRVRRIPNKWNVSTRLPEYYFDSLRLEIELQRAAEDSAASAGDAESDTENGEGY